MDERRYVGFYWTLPVRWAGFTNIAPDADGAARESTTIRYQRALARAYASEFNAELVDEVVFMELRPDRGTEYVRDALIAAKKSCDKHSAVLLWINFRDSTRWRAHNSMGAMMRELQIPNRDLPAEGILLDGRRFEPAEHFSEWRKRDRESSRDRTEMIALVMPIMLQQYEGDRRYRLIAEALKIRGIPTKTGKEWNEESVRKEAKKFETPLPDQPVIEAPPTS